MPALSAFSSAGVHRWLGRSRAGTRSGDIRRHPLPRHRPEPAGLRTGGVLSCLGVTLPPPLATDNDAPQLLPLHQLCGQCSHTVLQLSPSLQRIDRSRWCPASGALGIGKAAGAMLMACCPRTADRATQPGMQVTRRVALRTDERQCGHRTRRCRSPSRCGDTVSGREGRVLHDPVLGRLKCCCGSGTRPMRPMQTA